MMVNCIGFPIIFLVVCVLQGRTYVYTNMHVHTTGRCKYRVFNYLIWLLEENATNSV